MIAGHASTRRLVGPWFAKGPLLSDQPLRYRAIDLATGALRDATEDEQRLFKPGFPALTKIDGKLLINHADSGDLRGSAYMLYEKNGAISLAVGHDSDMAHAIWCRDPACTGKSIGRASWQGGANRVLFSTTDGVDTRLSLWDVRSGKVRNVATPGGTLNGGRESGLGCTIGDQYVVCVSADANTPPRLIAIDINSGRMSVLANPNKDLIGPDEPKFKALRWTTKQGVTFTGQLLMPPGHHDRVPLFITYYICDGFLRGGTGDEYPLRQLAAHGIAALCITRPASAVDPLDQIGSYREALDGVSAAVDLLDNRQLIDRSRIGMGGLSFGSEVTMWVASNSDLLAAAAISSTQTTATYYWLNAMPGRDIPGTLKQVWNLGNPDQDKEHWTAFSAAFRPQDHHAPLLMQMPEQEYRYNVELAARLGMQGTPVDVWAFPDEQHIKMQPRHKAAVYERNLDWFAYWLKGEVDPAAAKAKQYAVWQSFSLKPGWHDGRGSQVQERTQASTSASASTP